MGADLKDRDAAEKHHDRQGGNRGRREHVAKWIIRLRPHASLNASPDLCFQLYHRRRERKRLVPHFHPKWVLRRNSPPTIGLMMVAGGPAGLADFWFPLSCPPH